MNRAAYYNEMDTYAAQWLRNLIAAGRIAAGDVDERSVVDVRPDDLRGYTQCHFFAGIGVWSHALRLAGWPDDRPVWTGSCPCQPFSAAGKGTGFDDERHLWPAFHHLISQCRPPIVFGEQVASKDGLAWLDLVQADLEGEDYASAAVDLCAAGFGAPHIRQRLYWVGSDTLGNAALRGCIRGEVGNEAGTQCPTPGGRENEGCGRDDTSNDGACLRVADAERFGHAQIQRQSGVGFLGGRVSQRSRAGFEPSHTDSRPGPTNGFWRDADWLFCRDGKWRPVEPGTFPLVDGSAFRMGSGSTWEGKSRAGMLKGYGNAIVPQVAAAFIGAFMEYAP